MTLLEHVLTEPETAPLCGGLRQSFAEILRAGAKVDEASEALLELSLSIMASVEGDRALADRLYRLADQFSAQAEDFEAERTAAGGLH
jgi:hypothetical protein